MENREEEKARKTFYPEKEKITISFLFNQAKLLECEKELYCLLTKKISEAIISGKDLGNFKEKLILSLELLEALSNSRETLAQTLTALEEEKKCFR